jgi:hypothetical protein
MISLAPRMRPPFDTVLNDKWGADIIGHGFTAVPDVMLAHMGELGLTPTEFVVLLQLMRHWWMPGHWPFPSKRTIARAMGVSDKNIQKVIGRLEARGLLKRIARKRAADGNDSNVYDLSPLILKLRPIAAAEEIRRENKELKQPTIEFI